MASGDSPLPDKTAAGRSHDELQWTWLARLRRPQGRKGEIFAEILTDFPEKFADRRELWLLNEGASASPPSQAGSPRAVTLANHWLHKGGIVLHFAGVDSISAAEELAGLIAAVPRSQRVSLAEDEAYISDLVGCSVVDMAGGASVLIGVIEDVDRSAGEVPLLVVRGAGGKSSPEILIPFAKSYLRKIDLEGQRVEMELPVGLVDLDDAEEA